MSLKESVTKAVTKPTPSYPKPGSYTFRSWYAAVKGTAAKARKES